MSDGKKRKERYEILFENVNSKMDLVLEGYKEIDNKFDEAKRERQEIRNDLTTKIEFVAKSLNKKIEDTDKKLCKKIEVTEKKLSKRIEDTDKKLGKRLEVTEKKLDNKAEDIKSDLIEEMKDTEKRLGEKLDRIGSRQDTHESRIEVLEKKLSI